MLKITLNVSLATGDTAYIEADNPQELHTALGYLQSIGALRGPAPAQQSEQGMVQHPVAEGASGSLTGGSMPANGVTSPESASGNTAKPEAAPGKPKRQSKKTSAGAAAQSAETEQTAPAGTAPATDKPKPTAKPEDVTAAVTKLANATSLQQARAVLEQFGVKRAAELKPEQYDTFVAACDHAITLAGGGSEDAGSIL